MHDDRISRPSIPARGERTRLHIEGVRTPVLARVARRRETGMTCVQELPFLRLESAVADDHGRRARISRVALSVEKDVPKLVIELAYDDDDDDRSGPPGAPFGTMLVGHRPYPMRRGLDDTLGYDERLDAMDATDGRRLFESFRPDPMDSLREPPVTFHDLVTSLWRDLARGARALEQRLVRALTSRRPALA